MADNRSRYGFRLLNHLAGHVAYEERIVADSYQANPGAAGAVDLCIGDPVVQANDGTVTIAAAGAVCWGVIVGVIQYWDSVKGVLWPGTGGRVPGATTGGGIEDRYSKVLVVPVIGVEFEVDCDDAVTATTKAAYQAFVGENCDLSYSVDTTAKQANPRLDISTHVATTAGWRIKRISKTLENVDFSGSYVKLVVECNEVQNPPAQTAGI